MRRPVFNKFPSVLFHRVILLMIFGVTICLTLFVLRRRHVVKGIAQTQNERFNIKDIRIKPFEGLETDNIYFPSSTFPWYSDTYSTTLPPSSTTATTGKPEAQAQPSESKINKNQDNLSKKASVSNNLDSSTKKKELV
ncbi:uncharacterized protein LOC110465797 [Mizuhopecten yessoensis]|uniref:Uncharacterized protein n=1 Tax=Mizuhopecten yessoensis TaxID=6573 RepID=A0A210PQU3_MIZYE|nr:uncharacterized protein LOC110465797 [Mizuhopecten yessoensis]OWF38848.1 hypothetical protein KP79_PYT23684 [Mizuhopecten yessoensis]